ncbi:hypothetical protein [Pseudoalteromonas sp. P1-25]|uniref:hypothetical protein n=1 Tax=Pseudoalteromonas sp. P1-25 TaxID=1723758 RepID=UPI0006D67521|nr:hypothetical protein [Pseudoalteromonas sp. P1-25]KPZ56861.1 hypothetical protein AN393_01025 [Pseudoalteromonas sp. P1-25]
MRLLKNAMNEHFDLAIFGLGYESRSTFAYEKYKAVSTKIVVLGYKSNQHVLYYQKNKKAFESAEIIEEQCSDITEFLIGKVDELNQLESANVMIDITVMTRHRLALVLNFLIKNLKPKINITICYIASKYVCPPSDMQPVKKVGPLIEELSGGLGNLSYSTSAIFGLGYEQSKALGIYNYLEPDSAYSFIPKSLNVEFEEDVKANNLSLLNSTPSENTYSYNVYSPYDTYIDLKSLVLSLAETSRVIIVPLGPKILSAVSLIIGLELYPDVSVWRVSSLHSEEPMDRVADREILQTITL